MARYRGCMGKAVLLVLDIVLLVYAVFDLLATPADRARLLPKPLWFVIILFPIAGPLLWILYGHVKDSPPRRGPSGRPGPPRPLGPDDDPDYLRDL